MNKLLVLIYVICLLLTVRLVNAAPATTTDLPRWLKHNHVPVEKVETQAEHLARFQVQLTNALHLQPHQVCVLHHALLAQTDAPLPGAATTPAPTLTEALQAVLRPEQQAWLTALPTDAAFAPEFAALAVRP